MKFGMRTPSLKKSVKARTTGKLKRSIKKALIPGYGKRGCDGLKTRRKPHIIRFIIKQALVCLICLSSWFGKKLEVGQYCISDWYNFRPGSNF